MSFYIGPGNGLELLGRQAVISLSASINSELISVSNHWYTLDTELATLRGRTYASVSLESISNDHIHLGHRPSLIQAPIDNYPNISCMAYRAVPDAEQLDHIDKFSANLYIETMVKGTIEEGEELVNSRIERTTESVVNVIARDSDFGGNFFSLQRPPIVSIGDLFVRREEKGHGPRFLWQGSRLEYAVDIFVNPIRTW